MIITGAPVEKLEFEEVDYWDDLSQLMDNTKKNVFSTIHICWAAQAGLYHHYNAEKVLLDEKLFGVYPHKLLRKDYASALTRGFDDRFPVSYTHLAAALGEERVTIEDVYEPYLIQMGLLNRTQKGRTVSDAAYRHLGIERVTEGD